MRRNKILIFVICVTFFCVNIGYGQLDESKEKPKEPVLVSLTQDEQKIDPKQIVSNQPDFTAVESYFSARAISGFSAASKVARKGNRYRTDTGFIIVITEPGKPNIRINQDKTYEESVGIRRSFVSATSSLNPTDLLGFEDISFSALGTIEVDGNKLLKIQAKSKEFNQEVFLYSDLSKKNLITIVQIIGPQRSSIQRLQEISFVVPDNLFDISGYRQLPKFKWNKVKIAKVFHNGNLVNDALVFRFGDYVFIHVAEFDHFFVDLKKKIADTVVFQGLLVSADGNYVWRTQDDEATSIGELDNYVSPGCENCVNVQIKSNSLTIPDPENKSKILVKVDW
jgi:hypothetical protein